MFDLAAGVGSYLLLLPFERATIIAGDYNDQAVTQGKTKAKTQGRSDIIFIRHNDAFNLAAFASQEADILVSSRFSDILIEDEQIKTVLKNDSTIIKPGARWVFIIEENHPDLKLLQESLVDLKQKH